MVSMQKAAPMRGANGDILNWYGLSTDIHDRQLAEEVLRSEELNLRRLVDGIARDDLGAPHRKEMSTGGNRPNAEVHGQGRGRIRQRNVT